MDGHGHVMDLPHPSHGMVDCQHVDQGSLQNIFATRWQGRLDRDVWMHRDCPYILPPQLCCGGGQVPPLMTSLSQETGPFYLLRGGRGTTAQQ